MSEKRDSSSRVRTMSLVLSLLFVLPLPAALLGCSKAAAKQRCGDLVAKAVQFSESSELNGAHSLDEMRHAFSKQAKLFDDADGACREAKEPTQLAAIEKGRQALAGMRVKAEADAAASLEREAAKPLEEAREMIGRAKAALKKSDYKTAAPLLVRAVTAVAVAEETRATCIGLVEMGACGDAGAPSQAVRDAMLQAMVKSWLEHGKEGGIIRGPRSQDAADLVEEVHAIWLQNAAGLNAALAGSAPKPSLPGGSTSTDETEAKVRGTQADAEALVPQYVREQMNDPDSYEYVEGFGTGTAKGPFWVVTWTWKGANAVGGKVQNTKTFCVSAGSAKSVIPCTR